MRILFVCENYIPHYGGAEVVFKNLAERYVKRGHKVTLITHQLEGTPKEEIMGGVKVIRVPSLHSRYIFSFTSLPKVIRLAAKHDIIQTTTFNGMFPAFIGAKIVGRPVVLTIHEVWVGKWRKVTNFGWLKATIHDLLERILCLLWFDAYVCVSNATKKDLLKIGKKESRVKTIYNGLDYEFWNPKRYSNKETVKIRKNLGLEKNYVAFSWGRPGESKGFEYAILAARKIKNKIPNFKLLFMFGSKEKHPEQYGRLMKMIKKENDLAIKHKMDAPIMVIDSVPYDVIGFYLKMADCAIIPSIAEGFGYTTAESIAMEIPVVASDAGSLPEVVSGKYLQFKSKDSTDLAQKVILTAKRKYNQTEIKKFEWKDTISKYLELYKELILNKK
jgi:D-inositol-3-phosphate glycosyltransferase